MLHFLQLRGVGNVCCHVTAVFGCALLGVGVVHAYGCAVCRRVGNFHCLYRLAKGNFYLHIVAIEVAVASERLRAGHLGGKLRRSYHRIGEIRFVKIKLHVEACERQIGACCHKYSV